MTVRDIFQWVAIFGGGGIFATLVQNWLEKRRKRLYSIPLIERVNRLIKPDIQGIVLARVKSNGKDRTLEEIENVREYQLTLLNTSPVHLHDSEIQFEFPSRDVEKIVERPALSRTALIPMATEDSISSGTVFRWRIPEFFSGDSMEFTFRAIAPASDRYEAFLSNGGQVRIEITKGEPRKKTSYQKMIPSALGSLVALAISFAFFLALYWAFPMLDESKATTIDWGGCSLDVKSRSEQVNSAPFNHSGPFELNAYILNTGTQKCFVRFEGQSGNTAPIAPGDEITVFNYYANKRPQLTNRVMLFGPNQPTNRATVTLYSAEAP